MEYSTRLLYKDKLHPEIYNSNLPLDQKLFFQNQLDKFGGDFDKLLEDIEKYAILSHVEDYETAAKIRDYRKTIKINYMKKLLLLLCLLAIISCNPLRRVNTDGFTHYNEYIIYKQDTVAKLTNIEYSLDNGKLVKEATFKLLDMKYGDKGKAIIAFVHNTHRDWEVELDYPISFSPFTKK